MRKLILTAAAGLLAAGANAQSGLGFGIEAGVQLANQVTELPNYGDDSSNTTTFRKDHVDGRPNIGLRAGIVAEWNASSRIAIQPSLLFVMKGVRFEGDREYDSLGVRYNTSLQSNLNLYYIQLPINFQYYFNADRTGLFAGFGPYFSYAFSGSRQQDYTVKAGNQNEQSFEIKDEDVQFGDNAGDDFKNLDIGVGVNLGYKFSPGFFVRAFGEYSFSNIYPVPEAKFETKNYGFGLTIGYMLNKKIGSGGSTNPNATETDSSMN